MTKKEYLEQLGYIDRKIKYDLMELEELRGRATSISSPVFGERVQTSRNTEPPFVRVLEFIRAKEEKLNRELAELEEKREEVKAVIEALPNQDERMVLLYRYVLFYKMEDIALEMHMSLSSVKRWHQSGIRNLSQILNL